MTLYITPDNKLHDDADGFALSLPSWPKDARIATQEEIDAIQNPPETQEQTIARLESVLDSHLDSVANSYRYDSIRTMATYDGDPYPKFDAEGKAAKAWRSACYARSIEIMNDVLAGNRGVQTESELIAEMPLITDYLTY